MDLIKPASRRIAFWTLLIMGIFCILIDGAFVYLLRDVTDKLLHIARSGSQAPDMAVAFFKKMAGFMDVLRVYFVPASAVVFGFFTLLLWLCLRLSLGKFLKSAQTGIPAAGSESEKIDEEERRAGELKDKRLFLHLLSVFQREGRLIDFFKEDIELYEDEQIGAAVRSIHENCRKTLDKYMNMDSVVDRIEGDSIQIDSDFDPNAIKLTGNVSGDPPFNGVVRHRGWKAQSVELPALSGKGSGEILSPAEVEIQ